LYVVHRPKMEPLSVLSDFSQGPGRCRANPATTAHRDSWMMCVMCVSLPPRCSPGMVLLMSCARAPSSRALSADNHLSTCSHHHSQCPTPLQVAVTKIEVPERLSSGEVEELMEGLEDLLQSLIFVKGCVRLLGWCPSPPMIITEYYQRGSLFRNLKAVCAPPLPPPTSRRTTCVPASTPRHASKGPVGDVVL
jgi:hypothetical protein